MEKTIKRNKLIDICKGIGIISIVIGHASWNIPIGNIDIPIGPFVYLYHLAIFFFCSGFLYKKEENDWGEFLKKKIKALYFPFVIYSVSFLLFRNFFITAFFHTCSFYFFSYPNLFHRIIYISVSSLISFPIFSNALYFLRFSLFCFIYKFP